MDSTERPDEEVDTQAETQAPPEPESPAPEPSPSPKRDAPDTSLRTRISGVWVGFVLAAIVLIFLLIFILQNPDSVEIKFLWLEGQLPIGVALLLAAICGLLMVAIPGGARIIQLRRKFKSTRS